MFGKIKVIVRLVISTSSGNHHSISVKKQYLCYLNQVPYELISIKQTLTMQSNFTLALLRKCK